MQTDLQSSTPPNCESFYQCLDEPDSPLETIDLNKEILGVERLLLTGQRIVGDDKFVLVDPISKEYQMLYLSDYRIIVERKTALSVPYGYIQEIKPLQKFIRIILKTGIYFDFYLDHNQAQLYEQLCKSLAGPPFCYNSITDREWPNIYDSYAEIQRMRVDSRHFSVFKNSALKFCPTYPLYFLVPKGIQVSNLNQVKKCRFYSRIPVLSFYNERTGVGLWRAAKRKQQISEQVRKFDISYIREIPGNSISLEIEQNALTKGNLCFNSLESLKNLFHSLTKHYNNSFLNPLTPKTQLYKSLSKWYDEIDKLISLAYYAVDFVNQDHHVILEEMYAMDRVSQVLVLAEIVIDPFFRTFDGLSIVIQKEFVSYGHPFDDRGGFNRNKENQISPIFIQLLECIHQLVITHPSCFEYTASYLARIAYELYTRKYKNFLYKSGDPQKEKEYSHCSMSIWQSLQSKKLRNPQYDKNTKRELWELRRKPSVKEYQIWVEYFDMICKMGADGE